VKILWIFIVVYTAMIATAFWESNSEGRHSWSKGKYGWKVRIGNLDITCYHFNLFMIMYPALLSLPLILYGWDVQIFGALVSAYLTGLVLEDFLWYVVNPKVKFFELFTNFSDYYPWLKIGKKKILPWFYIANIILAYASYYFLWR
jgi:hypothetical protein